MPRRDPFSEGFLQSRLRLSQLEFLLTIDRERSIAKAADRMNITQPAATKTLKDIEASLGIRLFERSRKGVAPTIYGELALRSARLISAEMRQLSDELNALKQGVSGRVLVGTLLAASVTLLPASVALLRRRFPEIAVQIFEGTWDLLLPMLRTGDLDLVLGRVPPVSQRTGLVVEDLYSEETRVVARLGHPLAGKKPLQLADILEADWILPSHRTMLRNDIDTAFSQAGLTLLQPKVESVAALANQRLLAQTDLLAFLPASVADYYVQQRLLVIIACPVTISLTTTGMLTRSERSLSPAAGHFASLVREVSSRPSQ